MNTDAINGQLSALYTALWPALTDNLKALDKPDEYTAPLLLQFSHGYFKENHKRIMFFGQETRGWQNKNDDNSLKSVEQIMQGYENYFISRNMKYMKGGKLIAHSSFRNGVVHLKRELKKRNLAADLIWNNINKIGRHQEKSGVNKDVCAIETKFFNVIPKEVAILQPDIFIFFTGPERDHEILARFPDFTLSNYNDAKPKEFKIVMDKDNKMVGLRTYHPNYLRGFYSMMNQYGYDVIEQIYRQTAL